ncbi:amidohydrolase family protein [Candidatus Palauibacter sp.]|uniref:amidohydrolase family protein n=1 Tax=Candidatus Palauibacter sp. TaxID=3101350 RepID=UPI003B028957
MTRKLARLLTLLALALALAEGVGPSAAGAQTLAVTGATVIDPLAGAPLEDGVVVIADGRIAAVGPAEAVDVPAGTSVIDARGKYVIPGLMDANVHLYLNLDLETLIKYEGRYHEIVLEAAQLTLKTGQTTVFDTWGPMGALAKARDLINGGEAPGSRIYFAGNIIGFDGPLSADFRAAAAAHVSKSFVSRTNEAWVHGTGRDLMWMTPDSVRAAIRRYTGTGVDFLKYGSSGHVEMFFISFSERVQRAIVEEGHRAGMTVQTHTTSVESLDMAIEAGVDIITHGDISGPVVPIPMETMRKLVERDIAVSVLPITQRRLEALQEHNPDGTLTPYMAVGRENQARMIEAGVSMLLSTDAGIKHPVLLAESATIASDTVDQRTKLGEGHFNALAALEELGMAPMEILRSATSHIARAYELDDEIGSLQPGMIADLVILDANPLEAARNYRSIHAVIKDGRWVDLDALPVAPIISVLKPSN